MKILFETYNTFAQNAGGGVNTKIMSLRDALMRDGLTVDLFDKWSTKVEEYDVIHFFKASIDDYNLMKYAQSLGKKIVLSSIVPLAEEKKIIANRWLCRFLPVHTTYDLLSRILHCSDAIITESQTESRFLEKYYQVDPRRLTALPNGVASGIANGNAELIKDELPFKNDFVLQVGRIDSNKNQLRTIRALNGTDIPLVIVGGPAPQEMKYYEQCRKEAGKNVFFTGWIPMGSQRLAAYYAAAKILILPSVKEIYGNVIVEGATNNCLLACSDSVPIADWEILRPHIHTFSPTSVNDIKHVVTKLFQEPTPVGQAEIFNNFFSWDRIAKVQREIYAELMA